MPEEHHEDEERHDGRRHGVGRSVPLRRGAGGCRRSRGSSRPSPRSEASRRRDSVAAWRVREEPRRDHDRPRHRDGGGAEDQAAGEAVRHRRLVRIARERRCGIHGARCRSVATTTAMGLGPPPDTGATCGIACGISASIGIQHVRRKRQAEPHLPPVSDDVGRETPARPHDVRARRRFGPTPGAFAPTTQDRGPPMGELHGHRAATHRTVGFAVPQRARGESGTEVAMRRVAEGHRLGRGILGRLGAPTGDRPATGVSHLDPRDGLVVDRLSVPVQVELARKAGRRCACPRARSAGPGPPRPGRSRLRRARSGADGRPRLSPAAEAPSRDGRARRRAFRARGRAGRTGRGRRAPWIG